jgi:hypothetical protein
VVYRYFQEPDGPYLLLLKFIYKRHFILFLRTRFFFRIIELLGKQWRRPIRRRRRRGWRRWMVMIVTG